ncbi:hypothetical protein K474DRAFT_1693896 [Panus rudis PR-1116 ss-1]|nr:hypothetical protein K474DRAFT_1693896 [Panus rudis PR-1116 ss-1]
MANVGLPQLQVTRCVCTRPFTDPGGYRRHISVCDAYQTHQRAQLKRVSESTRPFSLKRRRLARVETAAREKELQETTGPELSADTAHVLDDTPPEDIHPKSTSPRKPVRSNRGKLPARYRDVAPEPVAPTPHALSDSDEASTPFVIANPSPSTQTTSSAGVASIRTDPNSFGLFREYYGRLPQVDPEEETELEDLSSQQEKAPSHSDHDISNLYAPFPNRSAYLLRTWYWNGTNQKTHAEFAKLLQGAILDREFNPNDLRDVNWRKIDDALSGHGKDPSALPFHTEDGWREASVDIQVPLGKNLEPKTFRVDGLWYRPLEKVTETAFSSKQAAGFHYQPHRLFWQSPCAPNSTPIQVHGEAYTSEAFRDAYDELQRLPPEPGCELPRDVAACMLYSDSTHLAQFGNATLWPAYLSFSNQSKYERAKPGTFAHHHIAYFPKLPDTIQDFIHEHTGKEGPAVLLAHCRRELVHAIWKLILGPDFKRAYHHGIVVKCGDGITRRLYLRFFTYSADYPEKVLLASIRDMGSCPCPRCLIPKSEIYRLGQTCDSRVRVSHARKDDADRRSKVQAARRFIYDHGHGIASKPVEDLLKPQSLVPTENAFSACLSEFLPNYFDMFVPDLLHEWEIGVWKNLVTHLIRILFAAKDSKVTEFNKRF